MVEVNFEPAAFVQSLLCLIYCLTAKRKQYRFPKGLKSKLQSQHFVFLLLLISTIISSAASVGGAHLQLIASEKVLPLQILFHYIYFLFHTALSVCFALYIMHLNGSSVGRGRRFYTLFFLPFLLSEALILTNGMTGYVFFMDEQFNYHRGPMILVLYVCGLLYLITAFVSFFRHNKAISKTDGQTIGKLMVLCALGVVIQGVRSNLVVELFGESLAFLGMMMVLEERSGHIDPVTGVFNRVAMVDDMRRLIGSNQSCRVVFLKLTDMDLFSGLFNGREMENLLLEISTWLTAFFPGRDLYSYRNRVFGALFPGESDQEASAAADAILERFGQDWKTGDATLRLEAVVSVIRVPEDISSMEAFTDLMAFEYQNASRGSRRVSFEELFAGRWDRKTEQALRDAVEEGTLRVWYQPIWSVTEQRTVAAEALLRIDNDAFRDLSPEVYIPVAEKCGAIREIGLFVFEEVCRLLQDPRMEDLGISYIELNLSVHQFMYDDILSRFEEIRSRYGTPTERLNLEITESASVEKAPVVAQTMQALREIGYSFSLDDYGTGYSNMKQLFGSNYKNVKIDKSLLWEAEHNEAAAQLLNSLIPVIRGVGFNVVQEGVETAAQLERSIASGSNLIQGYYFSRPLPESEFIAYLRNEGRNRPEPNE